MKFLLLALIILLDQAQAWWGYGHLLVARVAYETLQKSDSNVIENVETILKILKESDPSMTKSEGGHSFVECATFADEIKGKGGAYQANWHFIDVPFIDDGSKNLTTEVDLHNITDALNNIKSWINKQGDYQDSYEYEQVDEHEFKGHNSKDDLSTALRLLIHYVGDIHQPLHATTRYDQEFPKGDRGGNSFQLPSKDGAKNLHAVWDAVVYEFSNDPNLPLSDKDWNSIGEQAATLMKKYDISSEISQDLNPMNWAMQANEIAESFVYNGIEEKQRLPTDYVTQGQQLAEKQLLIAGLRLANTLSHLNLSQWIDGEELKFLSA